MTTAIQEKATPRQERENLAQSLSLKRVEKIIKREYIGEVEGRKLGSGSTVTLCRWTIDQGRDTEKILELTNEKGLGAILHQSFFDLWREMQNEISAALDLAAYSAEMVEDYKMKGWSNKATFLNAEAILQAQERKMEVIRRIDTALYVAGHRRN